MDSKIVIYHNPRCRKSRETLQLIQDKGVEPKIFEYLKEPLSVEQLKNVFKKLGLAPQQNIRKGEKDYKENVKGKDLTEEELFALMVKYPKLIERPIVIKGDKAIVGRPPENVKELL